MGHPVPTRYISTAINIRNLPITPGLLYFLCFDLPEIIVFTSYLPVNQHCQ